MNVVRRRLLHTLRGGAAPSETLKRRALELEKKRKTRHSKTKDQFIVTVPESLSFLDTATIPMYFAAIGIALLAKLLMTVRHHHSSYYQCHDYYYSDSSRRTPRVR
ncbi:hypothetical protein glysoja_023627 [Glycine soja]|nr:hypothetical protein glysoja_023627 [Glycine soja]